MSALSNYAENLLLAWLLTAGAATRPTAWYVALHTGDPGEDGTANEVTTGTDADYVRQAVTFDTPSGGQALSSNAPSWTVATGSSGYTVTHASVWTASTSGSCLLKGQLLAARALVADDVFTFDTGEIVATLD